MAKKSMIERERKRIELFKKNRKKRQELKSKIKKANNFSERSKLQGKLQKLPKNSSSSRLRNRCWLTGRGRGYYRDFGLSRHVFREMAHECLLPGVQKSSW